jgi:hypothetical protein
MRRWCPSVGDHQDSGEPAAANSFNNLTRAIGSSIASAAAGVLLAQITIVVGGTSYPADTAFRAILVLGVVAAMAALAIAGFLPRRSAR